MLKRFGGDYFHIDCQQGFYMKRATFFTMLLGLLLCAPACDDNTTPKETPPGAASANSVDYSKAEPGEVTTLPTEESFRAFIKDHEIAVVKFGAEWCGPCKKLDPEFDKIAGHFQSSGIVFARVDVDELQSVANELKIDGIPDVIIFYNGQTYNRVVGNDPVSIASAIESMRQDTKPTKEVADAVKKANAPLEEELWKDENDKGTSKEVSNKKDSSANNAKPAKKALKKKSKKEVDDILAKTKPAEVKSVKKLDEFQTYIQNNSLVAVNIDSTKRVSGQRLDSKLPLLAGRFKEVGVTFVDVDVELCVGIVEEYDITAIPDFIVFYDGVPKGHVLGYELEEIYTLVEEVSIDPVGYVSEETSVEISEETSVEGVSETTETTSQVTSEDSSEATVEDTDENEVEFEENDETDDSADDGVDDSVDEGDDDSADDGDDDSADDGDDDSADDGDDDSADDGDDDSADDGDDDSADDGDDGSDDDGDDDSDDGGDDGFDDGGEE